MKYILLVGLLLLKSGEGITIRQAHQAVSHANATQEHTVSIKQSHK